MAEIAQQGKRLAPQTQYGRNEEEYVFEYQRKKDETTSKVLVHVLTGIVTVSAVLLLFASIFMRVQYPSIGLGNFTVHNPKYDNTTSAASVNVTFNGEIGIANTNYGRFVYMGATLVVFYRNVIVGGGGIQGGRVKGRDSEKIAVTMDVSTSQGLDTNTTLKLSSDVNSGELKLTNFLSVIGKIHLLNGLIKTKRTVIMNCTVTLNVVTNAIDALLCN